MSTRAPARSVSEIYQRHIQFAADSLLTAAARIRRDRERRDRAREKWERREARVGK